MRKNTSKAIGAVLIAGIVASGLNGMPLNNSVNQIMRQLLKQNSI